MNLKKFTQIGLITGAIFSLQSCSDDTQSLSPDQGNNDVKNGRQFFNVVAGINVEENNSTTYTAAYQDLKSDLLNISFNKWGYEVPSVRTARVYASNAGDYLYSLSYGGGTISKYKVIGGQNYSSLKTLDISLAMGTAYPRWTKVSDNYALIHDIKTTAIYNQETQAYDHTQSKAILTAIDLKDFNIITDYNPTGGSSFILPRSQEDIDNKLHVWRIDAPVINGNKAFYGVNKRSYDANKAENVSTSDYQATTLIVDFPSLKNPVLISSSQAKGSTQGFRTPMMHVDEQNDVYQLTAAPSKILKITNGQYDDSYAFDLSKALNLSVGANGWFYAGKGIGYILYYDMDKGSSSSVAAWSIARVDLYNQTAIQLNLPDNLWLNQYQNAVLEDSYLYMAIAPLGGEGNIYMFDTSDSTPNGFTKGAKIKTIDSSSAYLGIF